MSVPKRKSTRNPKLAYYSLAMPPDLYRWYRDEAERQFRSTNSLFVAALKEYQARHEQDGPPYGD